MTAITFEDLLMLDALGCLGEAESASLRRLLAAAGADADLALAPYRDAAALVAESLDPVAPPPEVKTRIVAAVRGIGALDATVPESSVTVRSGDGRWTSPMPGVHVRKLHSNPDRKTTTMLMVLEPGSVLPPHDHRGAEDSFVISGSCRIGSVSLHEGDFHHVDAGAHHGNLVTETGCTLLLIVDAAA